MILLRHGQSHFNLHFDATHEDPGIEDPQLTPHGHEQAAAAVAALATQPLTRIIVSPYTRALETSEPIRAARNLPLDILPEVRERAVFACDVGSAPTVLAGRFPQHEFGHLPQIWWHPGGETAAETIARAAAFRAVMAARRDQATTLVVSHWAFFLALTGRALGNGELFDYDPRSAPPRHLDWDA